MIGGRVLQCDETGKTHILDHYKVGLNVDINNMLNYPAPDRGTRYCFSIDFFVYLFLCLFLWQQDDKKTARPICMKFSGKVWSDHGTTRLNLGSIRANGSAGQRSICYHRT